MKPLDLNASQKTKSTPVGDVPVDWGCVPLGNIVSRAQYGLSLANQPTGNTRIVKMDSMVGGKLSLVDLDRVECSPEDVSKYRIRRGDILFNRTNSLALVGKTVVAEGDTDAVFASYIVRFQLNDSVDPYFVGYWFNSEPAQSRMKALATVGVSQCNINPTRLQVDFLVPVPPLDEQRKIAAILSDWDEAQKKLDALIRTKERRKNALMQKFITSVSARVGATHARHRIGEVCERVTRKNAELDDNVLTISGQDGLVGQKEYFARGIASADSSGYYLLQQGEFAYNRSTSKGYPLGAIKRLDRYKTGVVSTLYLCFRIKSTDTTSSNYLCHYFESGRFNSALRSIAKEGARAHGLLNVSTEEFFDLDIFLPTLSEQQKVANLLDTCDDELRLLRSQRAALEQQKRGLMQKLLTGKIRVKANHPTS